MQTQKSSENRRSKKTGKKVLKFVSALIVVFIVLAVFLVPAFVSSAKGRRLILTKINNSIDGKTNFAGLSMGWLKGIKVTDVSFNDSSGRTSIKVKQIDTKPHYGSILSGSVSLGKTIIDEPKVEINLKARQPKEAEYSRQKTSADNKSGPIALPIKKIDLIVKDGNLKITSPKSQTVELSRINSKVNLQPPGEQTSFDVDMTVVEKGKESKIHADGRVSAKKEMGWSLKGTSGNLTVEVNNLDLGSLAPFFALADVNVHTEGLISGNIESKIADGQFENLNTKITAKDLDITAPQLKGDRLKTGVLDIQAKLTRRQKMMGIENLDIKTDWLKAQTTGMVPTALDSFDEFLKSDSSLKGNFELDVAQLLSQMPQTFGAKENMKVTSGKLSGTIATATEAGKRKVTGNASLDGLKGTVDGKTISLEQPIRAEAEITAEKDKVIYDKVGFTASFGKIDCSGTSESLQYTADIDLSTLQTQLGQFLDMGKYQLAGQVVEKGTISTKKEQIAATGSSTVKNLRITSKNAAGISEPRADIDFAIGYDRKNRVVNINSIKTNASFGQVNIKDGLLSIGEKTEKPMKLAVSANNIDLEKIQPFAVLFASFPNEMQLSGIAESDVSISSEKQSYHVTTDSTHIKNLKVIYPEKKPFEANDVSILFDAEANPEQKTINVKRLQLISPQIKINKGEFNQVKKNDKTRLEGHIECEYNWSAVNTITGPYLPQGLRLEGQRKDTISFAGEYPTEQKDKLLENLNAKAKVGFAKAQYMGLNFGPTDVDIQIQNGLLKIAPFTTTVNNGRFSFASETNLKNKPSLLKTSGPIQMVKDIHISDDMAKKILMYVNPIFANAVNVSGVANFNCERLAIPLSKANKKDIEVIGTISVNQLRLQGSDLLGQMLSLAGSNVPGQDFTIQPTRFVLQNGLLQYEDMQLDIGDNPVNFKGAIGLDKTLNMTVTLPYTTSGRTARVGQSTSGKRISLPLSGSINKPELDMGKLLEEQLKDRLREKIFEGIDKLL